jgi:hypothetical protein
VNLLYTARGIPRPKLAEKAASAAQTLQHLLRRSIYETEKKHDKTTRNRHLPRSSASWGEKKLWKWFKQELAHALNLYFSWARPQERHWHVSPEKPALPEHEKIRPNIFQPRI